LIDEYRTSCLHYLTEKYMKNLYVKSEEKSKTISNKKLKKKNSYT
jgi:hypothetical protein